MESLPIKIAKAPANGCRYKNVPMVLAFAWSWLKLSKYVPKMAPNITKAIAKYVYPEKYYGL